MKFFLEIVWYQLFLIIYFFNNVYGSNFIATKNGIVKGTQERTVHTNKTYYAYRGIPFAKPPIGNLRFEPPQPVGNWSDILDATQEKNICVQSSSTAVKTSKIIGSEDCLYLNVYTPMSSVEISSNDPLAVMVWIHGGGFMEGEATYELYAPDYLINEDVIVVTLAYRLNLFGFLSTGDAKYPGNNGLKDQIMGLKWVKKNIRAFGGDQEKITLFGESAGAASVSYLTQTPLTKGLYSRAIMQSGSSLCIWALSRVSSNVLSYTADFLGVNANSTEELVEKLKSVGYKKLHAASVLAADRIYGNYPLGGLSNAPVIELEHPNAVVTRNTIEILQSGDFNPTPLMMGFNSMEAVDFKPVIEIIRLYLLRIKLEASGLSPVNLNIKEKSLRKVGNLIKDHYFGTSNETFTDEEYLHYIGDHFFVRDVIHTANLTSKHTNVFLYRFSHLGVLGNPLRSYQYGVGHAEELNYLFRRIASPKDIDTSDISVRDIMIRLWTNFAKYGNPTPYQEPLLQNVIWPKVDESLNYLDIQAKLNTRINPHEDDYKFWIDIFNKYKKSN